MLKVGSDGRVSDALLRKAAGAQRVDVSRQRSLEERARERERAAKLKRMGPAVRRGTQRMLSADTPIERLMEGLMRNLCRSLVLDSTGLDRCPIVDKKAAEVASALRNNSSILAITLASLGTTEIGLSSLFESLKRHPTVRAVVVRNVGLTPKALRALRETVRENPGVIAVRLSQTGADDSEEWLDIEEAAWMNRLTLADPTVNPFENLLFASQTSEDVDEDGFAWDAASDESEMEHLLEGEAEEYRKHAGKLASPVCGYFMQGRCPYGSRCLYYHPERREHGVPMPVVTRVAVPEVLSSFTEPSVDVLLAPFRLEEEQLQRQAEVARRRRQQAVAATGLLVGLGLLSISFARRRTP